MMLAGYVAHMQLRKRERERGREKYTKMLDGELVGQVLTGKSKCTVDDGIKMYFN
jgi:hypothetical protein